MEQIDLDFDPIKIILLVASCIPPSSARAGA